MWCNTKNRLYIDCDGDYLLAMDCCRLLGSIVVLLDTLNSYDVKCPHKHRAHTEYQFILKSTLTRFLSCFSGWNFLIGFKLTF